MTEEEAERKTCPEMSGVVPADNHGDQFSEIMCLASECMWWSGDGCGIVRAPSKTAEEGE